MKIKSLESKNENFVQVNQDGPKLSQIMKALISKTFITSLKIKQIISKKSFLNDICQGVSNNKFLSIIQFFF